MKRGTKELAIIATAFMVSCVTLNINEILGLIAAGIYIFLFIYDPKFRRMF